MMCIAPLPYACRVSLTEPSEPVQATGEEDHQHVGGRGGELASHFTPRLSRHTAALATALLTST